MGRFDALTQLEKKPVSPPSVAEETTVPDQFASKPANQQAYKEVNQQGSKPVNLLPSKEASKHTVLPTNQQISKSAKKLTTKDKQKIGSYLTPESWIELQTIAARTQRKDHEVLQEAVDLYLESLQK